MNRSTHTAYTVVTTLVNLGVEEVVMCPGSRNAPLSFAFYAAAHAAKIRMHVRVDERSAAFLALGLAMASAKPVPICVTSGTAVANVLPAFVEAHYSGIPLMLLSANRDLNYLDSGVGQIIHQDSLFQLFARYETHISSGESVSKVRQIIREGFFSAISPSKPGPVHIDIAFMEPLVPQEDAITQLYPGCRDDDMPLSLVAGESYDLYSGANNYPGEDNKTYELDISRRVLVIMGAISAWEYQQLDTSITDLLDYLPAVVEPTGSRPRYYVHPWALSACSPEIVIVIGKPTLHRQILQFLTRATSPDTLPDSPAGADTPQVICVAGPTSYRGLSDSPFPQINRITTVGEPNQAWRERCTQSSTIADQCVTNTLSRYPHMTGLHIATIIGQVYQQYKAIFVGASNPIRDFSLTIGPVDKNIPVYANRGASGIDGSIATAMGISYIRGATLAFMGDLTFLYDLGALLVGTLESSPPSLTIVVANDQGGGIFHLLEQGENKYRSAQYGNGMERVFTASHNAHIAHLCAGMHIGYYAGNATNLLHILSTPYTGIRVVEVACTLEQLRDIHTDIKSAIHTALTQ